MAKLFLIFHLFISVFYHVNGFASEKLVIDGSTGVKPLVESLAKHYSSTRYAPAIEIGSGLKPDARIQALIDNKVDIVMASHGIDIQQITKAGLKVHPIAKVAVVIGVNHTVSVSDISHKQLCEIYSGNITNWQRLDGANMPITPFVRPFNEVDSEVVVAHVPCFSQLQIPNNIQLKQKSGQMARALANTNGAIGMTTLIRVAQSKDKINALAINNIEPTPANILTAAYPLTRDLFLITKSQLEPEVASFLAFIRSAQGANIIKTNHAAPFKQSKGN